MNRSSHKIALAAVLVLAIVVAPATGWAAIRITKIRYNPPGGDTRTNRHLNHEFVVIKNTGDRRVVLTSWTLAESRLAIGFVLPRFRLGPGERVTIHSGIGNRLAHHLFWNRAMYVWDNFADAAVLEDDDGKRVDRCRYVDRVEEEPWVGHAVLC